MASSRSRSRSRPNSTGSMAGGAFHAPEHAPTEKSYYFCNAFWSNAKVYAQNADSGEAKEGGEVAREGYESLLGRMKTGTRTLDELRSLYRERAVVEEEYAKKLSKLAKVPIGVGETGLIEKAIIQTRAEMDLMSKSHIDLATLLKNQETQLGDFINKREGTRKLTQTQVEKSWKNKCSQESFVYKAKSKYQADAIAINSMNAQAALSQGRDLDKLTLKMDKTRQTVESNQRDYHNYVKVLSETTAAWDELWKGFCDLCQDQEEERLDFVKARLWDWTNALATVAMAEDESAERTRIALEQCDAKTDLQVFVRAAGTGSDIPDPPAFVDAKKYAVESKQTFHSAHFERSSTRIPGVKHSPSAVQDITNAFHHASIQGQTSRPVSGYGSGSTSPNKTPGEADGHLAHQQQQASGRFAVVSPHTQPPPASRSPMAAVGNTGAKMGHAVAASFQRRDAVPAPAPPPAQPPTFAPAPAPVFPASSALPSLPMSQSQSRYADADTSSSSHLPAVPSSSAPEDDDDPLLRAIDQLASTPPLRIANANTPPMVGGIALPGMSDPMKRQSSFESRQRQQSLGRPSQSSSRPSSPGPAASLMEAPTRAGVPQVVEQYGQAFPNERNLTRSPSSQQQQTHAPRANLHSPAGEVQPQPQSQRPQSFVGIGARGRSPSPQPFQQQGVNPYGAPRPQAQPQHYQAQSQGRPTSPLVAASASTYSIGASVNSYTNDSRRGPQYASPVAFPQVTPQQQQQQSPYSSTSPSVQQPYYPPTSAQGFHHQQQPQQGYQPNPPPSQTQYQQQQPLRPASIVSQSSYQSGGQYYASPPVQQAPQVFRTNSSASGYSQHSVHAAYASNTSQYAPPPTAQQAPPPVQHARGPSTQFSSDGKKIVMYVTALYDYQAAGPEEFSFRAGEVLAVTHTDPDGWWQGEIVGSPATGGGKVFPSNFVEIIPSS